MDAFRAKEKKYKLRKDVKRTQRDPDQCNDVLDFNNPGDNRIQLVKEVQLFGERKQVYAIQGYEGFYVIPRALPRKAQLEMVHQALTTYPEKPNHTNLDPFHSVEELTDIWAKEYTNVQDVGVVKNSLLSKLRWATMGYQYDWTARTYPLDSYTHIPHDLALLSSFVAESVGYTLQSEAAIVNYYMHDSQMGPHKDESELTYDHPVVSYSMGSSAVFLLGGDTRQEEPVACFLRSGDISILGGPSRLRLHGVARILMGQVPDDLALDSLNSQIINRAGITVGGTSNSASGTRPSTLNGNEHVEEHKRSESAESVPADTEELLLRYLQGTRVNINVRQVFAASSNTTLQQGLDTPESLPSGDAKHSTACGINNHTT